MRYYKVNRIWKDRDHDLEQGDVGFIPDRELPELVFKFRFRLEDVVTYYEWVNSLSNHFNNSEPKTTIYIKHQGYATILVHINEFDKAMEDNENKIIDFKKN